MSKESYARGFVKAAAAAGVDPTGLAKFAQQYKTEGWAPKVHSLEGATKIPHPTIGGNPLTIGSAANPGSIYGASVDSPDEEEILVRSLDPRRAAFNAATTNAANKVWKAISQAGYRKDNFEHNFSPRTIKLLEKLWNDEMKRTTSAPPAQVSGPAAKK